MREGRTISTYRTGSSFIRILRGQEGPKHDPYAYTEWEIVPNDIRQADKKPKVTLHLGLATWLRVGAWRDEPHGTSKLGEQRIIREFERHLGCTLKALDRAMEHIHCHCRVCGGGPAQEVDGFPGETFTLCAQGHVMDGYFNEDAIL